MATSTFFTDFKTGPGAKLEGYTGHIYLVPSGSAVNNSMPLTEDTGRPGSYYRENVADGEYKVYIDTDKSGTPVEGDLYKIPGSGNPYLVWHGEKIQSTIAANFNADGTFKTKSSGTVDGAQSKEDKSLFDKIISFYNTATGVLEDGGGIAEGTIATEHVRSGAITGPKLAPSVAGIGLAFDTDKKLYITIDGASIGLSSGSLVVLPLGITTDKVANTAITKDKINADVAGPGIKKDTDGSLAVNVDGSTIEISLDAIRVKDSSISISKLTQALIDYINASGGGIITNNPDDITLNSNGSEQIQLHPTYKAKVDQSTGGKQGTLTGNYGGNTRGNNATDFQAQRALASQIAAGENSFIAGGKNNTINAKNSHATGENNFIDIDCDNSSVSGHYNEIRKDTNRDRTPNYAHAEGDSCTVNGWFGHTEGAKCIADGFIGHAQNNVTVASGNDSHSEGIFTVTGRKRFVPASQNVDALHGITELAGINRGYIVLDDSFGDLTGEFPAVVIYDPANPGILRWAKHPYGYYRHTEDGANMEAKPVLAKIIASAYTGGSGTKIYFDLEAWAYPVVELYGTYAPYSHGNGQHSEGRYTQAVGYGAHSEGTETKASGNAAHAEGNKTNATKDYSHAEGDRSTASGIGSHAEGYSNTASGTNSHAENYLNTASGENAHAEGGENTASGAQSHVEGLQTTASGNNSHAEGRSTTAAGYAGHAEGQGTYANGNYSHAEGRENTASGESNHVEGYLNQTSNIYSHAEGDHTQATGQSAHAEGSYAQATDTASHAEGYNTRATKPNSHAEGGESQATAAQAHAEGLTCIASGVNSHAQGNGTTASGVASDSSGMATVAAGEASVATGKESKALRNYQKSHAAGKRSDAGDAQESTIIKRDVLTGVGWDLLMILDALEDGKTYVGKSIVGGRQLNAIAGSIGESCGYEFTWIVRKSGATITTINSSRTLIGRDFTDSGDGLTTGIRVSFYGQYPDTQNIYFRVDGVADRQIHWVVSSTFVEVG